jgi:hypothetical protein
MDLDSRLKISFRLRLEAVEFRSYFTENGAGYVLRQSCFIASKK